MTELELLRKAAAELYEFVQDELEPRSDRWTNRPSSYVVDPEAGAALDRACAHLLDRIVDPVD